MELDKSIKEVVAEPAKATNESISKTMHKKIRSMTKNQLVDKLIATSNYAEQMKAANMLLIYQVKQLNEKLNGAESVENKEQGSSNEVI